MAFCVYGCDSVSRGCAEPKCLALSPSCQGNDVVFCNGSGTGIDATKTITCSTGCFNGECTAPAPPTGVAATAGVGQNTVSWNAALGAIAYQVFARTTGGSFRQVGTTSSTSFTHTSLPNGETYLYVVRSNNVAGTSEDSAEATATTILPAPSSLNATPGLEQVSLNWPAVSNATGYKVFRSTTSGSGFAEIAAVTSASYTDAGRTNGTTYYYVAQATRGTVVSENSTQASATTTMPAPTNLTATTAGSAQINLAWIGVQDAASYEVRRSITSGSGFTAAATVTATSHADTGLASKTRYYYVVRAETAQATSADSNEADAISNIPPVATRVTLAPVPVYTNDTLTATPEGTDVDGDPLTFQYRWFRNGSTVGDTTATLSGATSFAKGDEIYVVATPYDWAGPGNGATSPVVTVSNSPPGAPGVRILPLASSCPDDTDTLTCEVNVAASDPDADSVSYTFSWTANGSATGITTATVDGSATSPGDVWRCTAVASDGVASGPGGSASTTVVTMVTGNILTATIWSLARSPYCLANNIQIGPSGTLTIQAGVTVLGNGRGITSYGIFDAAGSSGLMILLDNLSVLPGGSTSACHLKARWAHIKSGSFYGVASGICAITLLDSVVENSTYSYIWYPWGICTIERNIFKNSGGISIGTNGSVQVYVRNNVFYKWSGSFAIQNWASYSTSMTWANKNSFLSTDRIVLRLSGDSAKMEGTQNYWGGIPDSQVPSLIFDSNDDVGLIGTIPYTPTLSSPDPATPNPSGWIP